MVAMTKSKQPAKMTHTDPSKTIWITSAAAAERIGIDPKTLINWRAMQRVDQPPFYKPSHEVRYKLHEVDEWIESHRRQF